MTLEDQLQFFYEHRFSDISCKFGKEIDLKVALNLPIYFHLSSSVHHTFHICSLDLGKYIVPMEYPQQFIDNIGIKVCFFGYFLEVAGDP
jgi:hypothetical protein